MAPSFICTQCGDDLKEFNSMSSLQEHIKEVHIMKRATQPAPAPQPEAPPAEFVPDAPPPEPPKRDPVILKYKYEGQCPTCGVPVTTLDVVLAANKVMIAYCIPCNTKVQEQIVIPIEQQHEHTS